MGIGDVVFELLFHMIDKLAEHVGFAGGVGGAISSTLLGTPIITVFSALSATDISELFGVILIAALFTALLGFVLGLVFSFLVVKCLAPALDQSRESTTVIITGVIGGIVPWAFLLLLIFA